MTRKYRELKLKRVQWTLNLKQQRKRQQSIDMWEKKWNEHESGTIHRGKSSEWYNHRKFEMCCECSDWLLRKERHKSHLMVLFIHEEAREVIADTFFSCHFYAIMGFSCWYQLRRRALNNRYQLKQNAQLNVISVSGRRRETLIMIIKNFKIISADERGVGFWCLVNDAKRKSVIGPKTNHLPKHVSEIMSPMLPHCRWWGMKKDELEHLMFLRFVSHQIKDNERIFQNIFRILTQFPLFLVPLI